MIANTVKPINTQIEIIHLFKSSAQVTGQSISNFFEVVSFKFN
jgi:hypothetical protein